MNALELALDLRERCGGRVAVATMGPPGAATVLRQALYMGADEAFLVTDRRFAGAVTLASSFTLACAARKYKDYDLVLCGRQAIDGDTAQVGPQLAEKLGLPQVTYVEAVLSVENGRIRVRNLFEGGREITEAPLPALLTVVNTANTPRPPRARRIMRYKKAVTRSELAAAHGNRDYEDANLLASEEERLRRHGLWIHEWHLDDLDADPDRVGLAGSPTKVKQIESVVLAGREFENVPTTDQDINRLVHRLIEEHILS
jgi:electron transfer flavoprotein beta subunit